MCLNIFRAVKIVGKYDQGSDMYFNSNADQVRDLAQPEVSRPANQHLHLKVYPFIHELIIFLNT